MQRRAHVEQVVKGLDGLVLLAAAGLLVHAQEVVRDRGELDVAALRHDVVSELALLIALLPYALLLIVHVPQRFLQHGLGDDRHLRW